MTSSGPAGARERLTGGVDVWLATTEPARDADVVRRCRELLPDDELARCELFHQEADRRCALVTRALVRTTLSRYASVAPSAWRFAAGRHGRPEVEFPAGTDLRFNLSHTREIVVCAVTAGVAVGVDVERVTAHPDLLGLARTVLADDELEALAALPADDRPARFCALWALKEAYLKARGLGLSLSPRSVAFDLGIAGRIAARLEPGAEDDPGRWWFGLAAEQAGHRLALAVEAATAPPRVTLSGVTPPGADAAAPRAPQFLAVSAPPR